ncbi:MAG: phage tail tape measure protein [Bradyrhizobium sp.]|nr:phage tail tape measure protein [Bradyrhizobium sp.]
MSDNNLDIRARLTGEDRLSPTVVKLLAKIKSLEEQMAKFGKQAKNAITDIPMEGYVKQINATSKRLTA